MSCVSAGFAGPLKIFRSFMGSLEGDGRAARNAAPKRHLNRSPGSFKPPAVAKGRERRQPAVIPESPTPGRVARVAATAASCSGVFTESVSESSRQATASTTLPAASSRAGQSVR